MDILVGYTGFVGSNIYSAKKFDRVFNSRNIEDAYGLKPDLLVYAGVRAEKYLANNAPEKDLEAVLQAAENIKKIAPKKLVLISTIDVLETPGLADETVPAVQKKENAYGYNRLELEKRIRQYYPDALIIRLPGLFGKNLKKNFIYDFINVIPFMLTKNKMDELCHDHGIIRKFYTLQDNGFYRLNDILSDERELLKNEFRAAGFTALNFTDSRSVFQFYPLSRLWSDIEIALKNDIRLLHTATQPVSAGEIYEYLTGRPFVNELDKTPADYDYRTVYYRLFGGSGGYILQKDEVLKSIGEFVNNGQ